jgi:hypothetical protein
LASWTQPVRLGTLLHAGQTRVEPDGRTILNVTTQFEEEPVCVASAIEAESGRILWQRQLGVLPQQAPFVVKDDILLRDAQGVMRVGPPTSEQVDARWRAAGDWVTRTSAPGGASVLLLRGETCVFLQSSGTKLHVRPCNDKAQRAFDVPLPAPLQGRPELADGFLLLPLANGIVVRVDLGDGTLVNGPDWRAAGAEEQAAGYLALLSPTEFVLTDGSRGLARIASADGKSWDRRAAQTLPFRIVARPVLVPAGSKGNVCVLDASDTVTLLEPERLAILMRWNLGGKVTAGPFVRAGAIGCVVARNQLVWLDPQKQEPAWTYTFDADVVGEPQLIDGMLVVADVAGQFIALDPASGRLLGPRFALKANVAPTAAPMPFGPGRAFVLLTDGTIIVLPLDRLRGA